MYYINIFLNLLSCTALLLTLSSAMPDLNRCEGFFTKFVKLNKLTVKKSKLGTHVPSFNHKKIASSTHSRRFCVSRMKLLTSGDIELNPGPL